MFFSVDYTLPYDRSGVILSLSQVQNFPGDDGDCRPLQTPQTEGGTNHLLFRSDPAHTEFCPWLVMKYAYRAIMQFLCNYWIGFNKTLWELVTIITKRQFASHWYVPIIQLTRSYGLCSCPEFLSCTKNITFYAMINI
jgi:hypothetical protein